MKRKLLSVFAMAAMLLMGTNSWAQKTYEIGTAEQLNAFAEAVTNGELDANAVLTADIDYTAYPEGIIGISGEDYQGTFDGQGHKVTVAIEREKDGASLFWALGNKAVVKNLITDGTINTSAKYATGIATYHSGVIENCATYVVINSTIEGDGTHAGIAGVSYNGSKVINCLSAIKLTGEKTNNCGGITGWLDGKSLIQNCISVAEITIEKPEGSDAIARNNGNMTGGNNFFLNQYGSYNASFTNQVTANMVKSGALCYRINRDQSNIIWYQTLGQDEYPTPFATSKQVYAKCDNISCVGVCTGEATYANEPTGTAPAPHEYEKGICKNCGKEDPDYCPLVDGYYQISNAEQLQWFGKKIANGSADINGKLTADIDFTEYGKIVENGDFKGILDGQFHTITIDIAASPNPAPFNTLYGTVQNLKVAGTIDAGDNKFAAGIAAHSYSGSKVLNCTSSITIKSAVSGDGTHAGFVAVNESGLTINYCVFNGSMIGESTTNCGGIVGWSASSTKMTGCIIMPVEASAGTIEYAASRNPGNLEAVGCYYVTSDAAPVGNTDGLTEVTEEAAKSGEMCYKMNGDQSTIGWTQNVGTDEWPNNEGLGKQVYTDAALNCDGKLKADATGSYSNDPSIQGTVPEHQYENGVCVNCGAKEAGFMTPDADGYYNIADAKQLVWYASNINSGDTQANGRLVADIDMEGQCDKFKPIGTESNPFNAKFDGQSHRIYNLVVEQDENCAGLFGYVKAPCSIENLVLDETCSISGKGYCGLIGESVGVSGDVIMTNLGNEGTVTATAANAGGIIGCCMSSSATFIITNCYVTGNVTGGNESGAISGWLGDHATVTGTWAFCEVGGTESDERSFARYNGAEFHDCYGSGVMAKQVNNLTEDMMLSGELTYGLNGKSFKNPSWFQTIGEDLKPVLDNTHGIVYEANGSYADVHDEATYKEFVTMFIAAENQFCETVVAQQSLVDEYAAGLSSLADLNSMNAFAEAYEEMGAMKDSINACADAYAKYVAKVNETKTYLEEGEGAELEGAGRDFLQDYLDLDDEPGDYPNGASGYILENRLLSLDEILAEIDYITEMIDAAVRGGIMAGTDVTTLLKNPAFADGFNGWEGEKKATGTGDSDNGLRSAEVWANTMDMYQTLTDLQNGVYELKINGAYRPNENMEPLENGHGTNYAGLFYLNGVQNYFQAAIEDMLPIEDAQDKVNCLTSEGTKDYEVENEDGDVIGLIVHGPAGLSYAAEAGRYNNSLLVNVTDGTLTVGIKKLSTFTNSTDWLGFGNIKLTYLGELDGDQAAESLDAVLADMSARANTILNNYIFDDGEDYKLYPNFAQAIKDELQAAIDAVGEAADAEAKYALVQKFSDLFQQVYDCKKAYAEMVALASSLEDAALTLADAEKISMAEADALAVANADCWEAYSAGSYTYEQATNVEALKNNTIAPAEVDGAYQLANEKNMVWLSAYVNAGNTAIKAQMTSDIDMAGIDFNPIGNSNNVFTGTFDGQGHKFSNLVIERAETEGVGLIGFIATPATITDFVLDNTCSITGKAFVGIVGESAPIAGDVFLNKLGNEGTVTAVNQNAGGIIGCCMSSSATFYIENCYTTGAVSGSNESAAISGWTGSNSHVKNCWSTSEVKGYDSADKYFYRVGTVVEDGNNWCKSGSQVNTLSDQALTSGLLCFTLNGSSSEDPVWFQQLGVDEHPVFRGAIVYNNLESGEFTNTNPNAIDAIAMDGQLKANDGNVYDLSGRLVRKANDVKDLNGLKGLYIIGNKKYILK